MDDINRDKRRRVVDAVQYVMHKERIRTQKKLAEVLNIVSTNLSTALRGDNSYTEQLIRRMCATFPYISRDFLEYGRGEMVLGEGKESDKKEKSVSASEPMQTYEIRPSSLAKAGKSMQFTEEDIIGNVHFHGSSSKDICVRMVGQYMQPTIMNGSLMLISPIDKNLGFIEYGNTYLLVLNDSRVIVRQIDGEDSESDSYICSCANAKNPVNICKNNVKEMFLVKAAINRLAM